MTCPGEDALAGLLDLTLPPAAEAEVRAHLRGCRTCRSALAGREPSFVFATLPLRTLPEAEWGPVMRRVRAEVAAHPRSGLGGWWALFGRSQRLLGLGAPALAAALLVLLSLTLLKPAPLEKTGTEAETFARGFVYLSNPEAEVTHVLVGGQPGEAPTQLTMVIDATLEDSF